MNFQLSGHVSLVVESWANLHIGELLWSPTWSPGHISLAVCPVKLTLLLLSRTFDLDQFFLLDHISQLSPISFTLVLCLAHVGDLVGDLGHVPRIGRAEGCASDEGGIGILKRLAAGDSISGGLDTKSINAHRIFFLSHNLSGRLEVDTKNGVFAFVRLADVFDGVDVEGDGASRDGKDDGTSLLIDVYPEILSDGWQLVLPLIALKLAEHLLLVIRATLLAVFKF